MKIAAISDIHGNLSALEAVLADIDGEGVDQIVNLGDILSGPLWPAETADRLISLDFPTISGNHERQLLTLAEDKMGFSDKHAHSAITDGHREWLSSLPASLQLTKEIFLCHGSPASDLIYLLEEINGEGTRPARQPIVKERLCGCNAAVVLCGHTHVQRCVRLENSQIIVNPGSVGLPAYDDTLPVYHKVETRTPHARYAIITDNTGRWDVDLKSVEYDWERAAKLAEQRDRPDWASALRTGYL